jgi:uncharacterized protein YjbI with pentapeptide repeats
VRWDLFRSAALSGGNILKTIVPPNLPTLHAESFFLENEKVFSSINSEGGELSGDAARNMILKNSRIKKLIMHSTELELFECSDVIFENCDFSNLEWIRGSFQRVIFKDCKLIGVNFAEGFLRDCQFIDCIANLASFSDTKIKDVQFQNCRLTGADFYGLDWKNLGFSGSDLSESSWFKTKLAGLDLTGNEFEQIGLSMELLRGLIVDQEQAITIARGLGVIIRE